MPEIGKNIAPISEFWLLCIISELCVISAVFAKGTTPFDNKIKILVDHFLDTWILCPNLQVWIPWCHHVMHWCSCNDGNWSQLVDGQVWGRSSLTATSDTNNLNHSMNIFMLVSIIYHDFFCMEWWIPELFVIRISMFNYAWSGPKIYVFWLSGHVLDRKGEGWLGIDHCEIWSNAVRD